MASSSSTSAIDISTKSSAPISPDLSLRNLLREPLLHFIVLGGLLFAVDHFLMSRADDPHTIVVGADVSSKAIEVFKESRGRKPNEKELLALNQVWLDNEVLYREGLAMQVDKGDPTIRERVIFKALSMVEVGIKLPPIDDKQLREWFEQHREKYDDPTRYNFEEAVLSGDQVSGQLSGDKAETAVRNFVAQLNAGSPADAQAGLRVFKDRPQTNIEQSYGAEFRKTMDESTSNVWRAVQARDGWHAIRLISITPAKPGVFETLRGIVLQDWTDATASEQRTAAVRELAKKYKVVFESKPE